MRFSPPGQPAPRHLPKHRKHGSQHEEQRLRALGPDVRDYLDYALQTPGIQRHRFLRELLTLSRQVAQTVFVQTLQRALRYRVVELQSLKNIAWFCLSQGEPSLPYADVDESFCQRPAYEEGALTDEPDLSQYDDPDHEEFTNPSESEDRLTWIKNCRTFSESLRLGGLLAHWDELLAQARQGRFSHERLLRHVLQAEYRTKSEKARLLRRKRAHIPELLELETFPFARQPKLDRQRVMSLYDSFDYMTKQRNIVWMGPTGCGKTGLATGFLLQALDRGYRGYFVLFPDLVAELYRSLADHSERQGPPQVRRLRLSADRRSGSRGHRTRPGRLVLHPDAEAAQDQDHADHLQSGLRASGARS